MSDKGKKWDGKSRVTTEFYRKRYDEIFKKKTEELEDEQTYKQNEELLKGKDD